MATNTIYTNRFRPVGGGAGAPTSMESGEIAYNMDSGVVYIGFGDNGSGQATSAKIIAVHDFSTNKLIPVGGTTGQILAKVSGTNYDVAWIDPPEGVIYDEGTGILIDGDTISVDTSVIATMDSLTAALATKADVSHTHAASDITSGTLDTARIPNLDASKITAGTLDPARLPSSLFAAPVVSSGSIADLDSGQQTAISGGSQVVTTDGRLWVYSGSGSKTSEASYVNIADSSPDWSVIANKPAFGTLSLQDDDDVAITGGEIEGVTLDNVTITNSVIRGGTF